MGTEDLNTGPAAGLQALYSLGHLPSPASRDSPAMRGHAKFKRDGGRVMVARDWVCKEFNGCRILVNDEKL